MLSGTQNIKNYIKMYMCKGQIKFQKWTSVVRSNQAFTILMNSAWLETSNPKTPPNPTTVSGVGLAPSVMYFSLRTSILLDSPC